MVLLLLGQHIEFGGFALRLIAKRVGHDDAVGVLHLIICSLATRGTNDFYHIVCQHLEYAACLVVAVLALQVVGRVLVGAVGVERQYGTNANDSMATPELSESLATVLKLSLPVSLLFVLP